MGKLYEYCNLIKCLEMQADFFSLDEEPQQFLSSRRCYVVETVLNIQSVSRSKHTPSLL
jgi:hypothetical protein